jgi:hypothetical protein
VGEPAVFFSFFAILGFSEFFAIELTRKKGISEDLEEVFQFHFLPGVLEVCRSVAW